MCMPRVARRFDEAEISVDLLAKKLKGYHMWYKKYPGFRGYMPWFDTDALEPTEYVQVLKRRQARRCDD